MDAQQEYATNNKALNVTIGGAGASRPASSCHGRPRPRPEDYYNLYDLKHREDIRRTHLKRFYDDFLPTYFPFDDELEPLEFWEEMMDPTYTESVFHVLLAFEKHDTELKEIVGGCVFEYWRESRCGLISYFVVSPACRGKGLGRFLIEQSVDIIHRDARAAGLHNGCPAIFAETNDPTKVKAEDDTVPPEVRVRMLQRIGFKRLEMEFVQPPLEEGKNPCSNLWLAVYQPDNNGDDSDNADGDSDDSIITGPETLEDGSQRLAAPLVLNWVKDYWQSNMAYYDPDYESHADLQQMINDLSGREYVRVSELAPLN
ncbi:hypothetical protein QOT17_017961 [Balamuthia mandrillaris]